MLDDLVHIRAVHHVILCDSITTSWCFQLKLKHTRLYSNLEKHEDVKNTIPLFDSDNLQKSLIFRGYKIALSVDIIWISACPLPPFGLCRQSLVLKMLP